MKNIKNISEKELHYQLERNRFLIYYIKNTLIAINNNLSLIYAYIETLEKL